MAEQAIQEKVIVRHELPDGYVVFYEDTEHLYTEDPGQDIPLAGVSSIVSPFKDDPDKIMDWACWLARSGLDWREERTKAAKRGSRAHKSLEALARGEDIFWDEVPDDERGYHMAIEKFWEKYKPRPILSEVVVASRILKVAGTFDLVAELPKYGLCLIDLKTSKHIGDEYHCQLAGYESLGIECQRFEAVEASFILQVDRNGKERLIPGRMNGEDFEAALDVYQRKAGQKATKKGKQRAS